VKLGIFLIILGVILLIDGGRRIARWGLPGLSGLLFAAPCFWFGIRRLLVKKSIDE